MAPRSNSQEQQIGFISRLQYLFTLVGMHMERLRKPPDFTPLKHEIEFYRAFYSQNTGRDLSQATILEIGFGQRPFRLIAMRWLGYNAVGVDLDQQLYEVRLSAIIDLVRSNGLLRTMKSLARRIVFDPHEYRGLYNFLHKEYGPSAPRGKGWLIKGDIGADATWARLPPKLDFVYSEDVFEHIPKESLATSLSAMQRHMVDRSVAVVTPNVFTGIAGGHDLEWYAYKVRNNANATTPAWGHLTGEAKPADTFLNRLSRKDFRELLGKYFRIDKEEVLLDENLGRQYLTPERRKALSQYDESELFSNKVRFSLVKNSGNPNNLAASPHVQ